MKNIFKILRLSKPLYPVIATMIVFIFLNAISNLIAPLLSKNIVDQVQQSITGGNGSMQKLILYLVLAFVAGVFSIAVSAISDRLGDHFAGRLRKYLTEKFYHKVLTLPQEYFDTEVSGKIINQLNRGISSIQGFMNTATNFIFPSLLQSIFIIILLAVYNVPISAFTLVLFPIYLSLSYYSSKKWGEKELIKNKIEDKNRGRIQEVILNMKLVKSFMGEKREYETVSNNLRDINAIYAKQSDTFHIFDYVRNLSLEIILLVINVIIFVTAFNGGFSLGTMVLLIQLVAQARYPLFGMSFILGQIQMGETGSKEYFELIDLKSKEFFENDKKEPKLVNPNIEFKDVSFKYASSEMVLKDVNFKIEKHEKIALVGHSGAGKSTIINLILKFYEVTKGEILIGGKSYKDISHDFIRQNIALVFQENELFSSSIFDNVAYGYMGDMKKEELEKKVIEALKVANAYEFVMKLPNGIQSEVGERGVRLSGGQKQRIQIARAIVKDAPILILDEATSSLDSKSEYEVQEALEKLMEGRLTIIIAHRFSTIQNVDRIIVFEDGKIQDQGSSKELSQRKGLYSDLLKYQVEGNKKLLANFELY
ncbi:MAG: ABC transporter ATP-binding protein [bacterium]